MANTEIDIGGVKFRGGRLFLVITVLSSFVGILWGGFQYYQKFLDMEKAISEFQSPDLSKYDEQIAVLKSEVSMIVDAVTRINSVIVDQKNTLRDDIKTMKSDIRAIDKVVNDIEDRVKANEREISEDFKILEKEIDDKIKKALNNPLAGVQ